MSVAASSRPGREVVEVDRAAEAGRRGARAVHGLDVDAPARRRLRVAEPHDAGGHAHADAGRPGTRAVRDDHGARRRPATAPRDAPQPVAPRAGRRLLGEGRHQRRAGGGVEELRRAGRSGDAGQPPLRRPTMIARPPDPRAQSVAVATVPGGSAVTVSRAGPRRRAVAARRPRRPRDGCRLAAVVPDDAADVVRLHDAAAPQPRAAAPPRAGCVVGHHRRAAAVLVAEPECMADLVRGDLLEEPPRPAAGRDPDIGRRETAATVARRARGAGDADAGEALGAATDGADLDVRAVGRGRDEDRRACRRRSTPRRPSRRRCRRRRRCGRCT